MFIYNTLTEKKERFEKPAKGAIKLFVCGPTVYDLSHIGHAKTYISFDVMVRYLRARKFKVLYLQNITDVDDRIIEHSKKKKKRPLEFSREMEEKYHEDMKVLGVTSVDQYARASDFITAIQQQIKTLINRGFAYKINSGVYFEIRKFPRYGQLSKQNLEALRPGWRIEPDSQKRDTIDFALWKISNDEPNWPSPWGIGRPGWHIEDTAITEAIFGQQYDLHGGGIDLKFPHHESEIAQQEAASGKTPFVKIWLHIGFLLINGEKMSKSVGNFITIQELLKSYDPVILRFLITSTHYRSSLNYTDTLIRQAKNTVSNAIKFLTKLELVRLRDKSDKNLDNLIKQTEDSFLKAMDDDFNTPEALASIFSLINNIQEKIWDLSKTDALKIKKIIERLFDILGLDIKSFKAQENIQDLANQREIFRKKNNFASADELRRQIQVLGYDIEDTPGGPLVTRQ